MSKTIADYTAAVSIDAGNDYLLIEPSGNTVYKKINRNVLLGISSAPLGLTDSQSPTNKTFDNTNTITIKDTLFTIQDDGDATKQVRFQLSGITTGNTRTLTVPNASVTLASLSGTETLTNKTITSPVITGGTIDNSTITVDSISGHTSGTLVTVANLQISNGVLNTANAVTATSIADGAIQPKALVTGTGSGWAWQSWSPTPTNFTLGNGTMTGNYIQIGKTVFCKLKIVLGSTSVMGTNPTFTVPVTPTSYYTTNTIMSLGLISMVTAGLTYNGYVTLDAGTTYLRPLVMKSDSTYVGQATSLTAAVPGAWTTSDFLYIQAIYEAT